jgi:polyhydroxyalkanoate synthase subunit PhaC
MTDESVFEVGRNVATTEGSVVFENELFQLIEYKPLTAKVHERPILLVPPCINKYYILDLQPDNSLIRYTRRAGPPHLRGELAQPRRVAEGQDLGRLHRARPSSRRSRRAQDHRRQDDQRTLGFCVGGTILARRWRCWRRVAKSRCATAPPADHAAGLQRHRHPRHLHRRGLRASARDAVRRTAGGPGLLPGQDLATTFSFLRPNDLVWNYVVGNYLKGEAPPPFDLLYWNGDSTNLPGPMYCWYLRHTYLQNRSEARAGTVCGEKVDLGKRSRPGLRLRLARRPHRALDRRPTPRPSCQGAEALRAGRQRPHRRRHQPAAKGKRSHWINDNLPAKADDWIAGATEHPGSWWTDWSAWLKSHAGKLVAAPKAPATASTQADRAGARALRQGQGLSTLPRV